MKGNINPEELASLKDEVDKLDDEELDEILNSRSSDIVFQDADIEHLHGRLSSSIRYSHREIYLRRIFISCAAVLLPLLIISGALLIKNHLKLQQYNSFLSQQISLKTQDGEYSNIVLPDGSKIDMGPKSDLSYNLSSFFNKNRKIEYDGEGTFKVAKRDKEPFTLKTSCFEISVLGTEFSIISRKGEETSEIYLEKGSIKLSALASNEYIIMKPGETAILSHENGTIKIFHDNDINRSAGQAVVYFNSSSIADIAEKIKLYYGVRIVGGEKFNDVTFTGSLPTNNLSQLIYILENTLNISLEYDKTNHTLMFKK